MRIDVYAIPEIGRPFLMFIADMGEEYAHQNARKNQRIHTQKLIGYEFRNKNGDVRRFDFEVEA